MTTYTGWHFLADPHQLAHTGGPVPPVGESVSIDGKPILCKRGFHASRRALDALYYAPGPWAEKVRLEGSVIVGEDKAVGTRRVSLTAPVDVSAQLRLFACDCAERVLPIYEAAYPGDERPRRAIEVARLYAAGKATAKELRAAAYAAYYAANDAYAADDDDAAAHYAAHAAANAAAAAHYAAHAAAANYAAYYAANDAYAAHYAAHAAAANTNANDERAWQERRLSRILREAIR